jgi:hypothetical protein
MDALPILGDVLIGAPAGLAERLFEDFHVQAVYSKQHQQVTIRVTITDTTPHAVARILADPRRTTPPSGRTHPRRHQADVSHSSHDQRG